MHLIDPVGYLEFLSLESTARAFLTDSGGVQEETTFLGVPCFTLRDNTERPVTIERGTNTLLGLDPTAIGTIPARLAEWEPSGRVPEMWDGKAGERAVDAIASLVAGAPPGRGLHEAGHPAPPKRSDSTDRSAMA